MDFFSLFFLKLNFKNLKVVLEAAEAVEATIIIMNTQTLKELGIERKKVPSNIRNEKSPLDFCSISDRSVSSGGTLLPWVSITALASARAAKPTLGRKVPPLEPLLLFHSNIQSWQMRSLPSSNFGPLRISSPLS